jgi:hypothetical protein
MTICSHNNRNKYHLSRNNQHYAQTCTTAPFYILAPTCFGSSLPSSGSFRIRLSYMKIQTHPAGTHNRRNHDSPAYRPLHYTEYTQKNGAISKVNKKSISHLTLAQRTPSAAATVQVFHSLPAVPFSCLLRGRGASFQDGVAAGKGFLCAPF